MEMVRTSRVAKNSARLANDLVAWMLAIGLASALRYSTTEIGPDWDRIVLLVAIGLVSHLFWSTVKGAHSGRYPVGSSAEILAIVQVWLGTAVVILVANFALLGRPVPILAVTAALPCALMLMFGGRFVYRAYRDVHLKTAALDPTKVRVVVFGAGEGGEQIIRAMLRDPQSDYVPVALLDDSNLKAQREIMGVPVLGGRHDLVEVAGATNASTLLIAVPSADSDLIAELDQAGRNAELDVRILPSTSELLGMLSITDIRELTEADLLGRTEVDVDLDSITEYVTGKRVLVTGAGGSIGSELCRQLHQLAPAELFMLDRDESALHGVQFSIEGRALLDTPNLIVADIRDRERINEIFAGYQPEVVFHTAALKHLTLLENHPEEGTKTNVTGTWNLLEAAKANGIERFVNVSTDKAANPTSVLGRTKLMAERHTARAAQDTGLPYVSVRFGNVLGSRGSVLPTFRDQIANGGPITITDPDVSRYFMTIPEAVRLVLQSGAIGLPGEILILDMGEPVKIVEMAKRLIAHSGKNIDITYTGLRPGEKMHEELIATDERSESRQHPRITHTQGQPAGTNPAEDGWLTGLAGSRQPIGASSS
jgi:FlaA1/EpsC-like NDP-sugar epimerase